MMLRNLFLGLLPFVFLLDPLGVLARSDSEITILEQGVVLVPETILTAHGHCSLKLQGDGNLVSKRTSRFWDARWNDMEERVNWHSGKPAQTGQFYAILDPESGNLQVIHQSTREIAWSTHVPPAKGTSVKHELIVTPTCRIGINRYEETIYDPSGTDYLIWVNIKHSLHNFDADLAWGRPGYENVLERGQFFSVGGQDDYCYGVPLSITLQHDCNLVVFVGVDKADKLSVIWSSGKSDDATTITDCYLLVDSYDTALYAGSFDPTTPENSERPGKYWSVRPAFFEDVVGFVEGSSKYRVRINGDGQLRLDWNRN
eukprot:CAMPEP_0178748770 /NCGR_PEP_ID=MMETSP0744-20121128/9054_1 /TAXON_ID=913974 /ORGANISM="Nitzschia punctata, Strain CCMP561" /LENGTH=314 /DNA_ID=CAMNT_0020402139 /DNA_START=66 /DNA_END=1010 /DNA_ORIENTATION=-